MNGKDKNVLSFARNELDRCLKYITDGAYAGTIELELLKDCQSTHPFDDEIAADVRHGRGVISGSNPRSVLISVYAFLRQAGCRWLYPGTSGEYLPKANLDALNAKYRKAADSRHRCMCIEGANSLEHTLDVIDFLPKIGMNGYYMQFYNGYVFFERWYNRNGGDNYTLDMAEDMTRRVEQAVSERGLIYHKIGHGWTSKVLHGVTNGWQFNDTPIEEPYRELAAQINGRREWFGGVPDNTNLCYSNPAARESFVSAVVECAVSQPDVDILHVWMADECNNHCECEQCSQTLPSDYYVMMLNEIDKRLGEKNCPTKIGFIAYFENLYVPLRERLKNQDRFIILFAPITRDYKRSFVQPIKDPGVPFKRNQVRFPINIGENLHYLRQWQQIATCDSADYDYHLLWAYSSDACHMLLSKVLYEDIRGLKDVGLGGYISCQVQRAFFPNGWVMQVMGEALFDREMDYDTRQHEYFSDFYGSAGEEVLANFKELNRLIDLSWLEETDFLNAPPSPDLTTAKSVLQDLSAIAAEGIKREAGTHLLKPFKWLADYAELLKKLVDLRLGATDGKLNERESAQMLAWLREKEPDWHEVFDDEFFKRLIKEGNGFITRKQSK